MPVGIQSFEDLRKKGFVYVDKTEYVFKLAEMGKCYFLSRPRRFGKSLFLSTLKAYFLGQEELFDGLYIKQAEEVRAKNTNTESWIEHPVFYLDCSFSKYEDRNDLESLLNFHLSTFEEIYGSKKSESTNAERFSGLLYRAFKKTGKQVVILIDEYDKPLLQTIGVDEALHEEYRKILKAFYSVLKSSDQYIRFAFLTGVTKFSKISIFSDLNNLKDISTLNDYSEICGISQNELEQNFLLEITRLAEKNNYTYDKTLSELKLQYDGYRFATECQSIYNPFSLLSALDSQEFKNYWFATGRPTFLVRYLKDAYYNIPDLDGNIQLDENGLELYRADMTNVLPILFQSGYLTIKNYNKESQLYTLGFPNNEVRYAFLKNLLPSYTSLRPSETGLSIWQLVEDIRAGNIDAVMQRIKSIISGIPYDTISKKNVAIR